MPGPNAAVSDAASSRFVLVAMIAAGGGFALAAGLTYPVMSLALAARGESAAAVGLNGMMTGVGLLLSSPLIPRLVRRYGAFRVLAFGGVGGAGALLLMGVFDSFFAWCLLRVAFGAFIDVFFVISEATIAAVAPAHQRGRLGAVYTTALTACFAAGPALVPLVGFDGPAPFLIAAGVIAVASIGALPLRSGDPLGDHDSGEGVRLLPMMRAAAPLMMLMLAYGWLEVGLLSLLPVYVIAEGLAASDATLPLTALLVGSLCLQIPVGWLADRVGHRRVIMGCLLGACLLLALLPMVRFDDWLTWPLLVLLGGMALSIYAPVLALLGQHFRGTALAAGSAGFALAWGVGSALGPPVAGAAMTAFGHHALPLILLGVYALAALVLARVPLRVPGQARTDGGAAS